MKTQTGKAAVWLAATTISVAMLSGNVWAAKPPVDRDGDGWTTTNDCDDRDPLINPGATEICTGGIDENCNDLIDGDDPFCQGGSPEICNNGVDDDDDGLIDCADHSDCDGQPGGQNGEVCTASEVTFCADGFDNDADGLIDLADPDCAASGSRLTATRVSDTVTVLGIGPAESVWNSTFSVSYAMRWVDDIEGLRPDASADVSVKAIHNGTDVAIMMTWADPDESRDVFQTTEFADRAAIMFNANRICHMGSPNSPTNMWFWNAADDAVQNLLSGGLGTITHTPTEPVNYDTIQVVSSWANGVWQVVFSRTLDAVDTDYQYEMYAGDTALEVSFGTWDGGKQMRNGMKWISGIERMDINQ